MIHMRHEQTCAYAADAWARTTGTPWRARRHGRLRPDQRRHRPLRRRPDRQPRGLPRGPASDDRGRPGLVPGGLRLRHLPHLLQVHASACSTGRPSRSTSGRRFARRWDRRRARRCSRFRPTSSTSRTTRRGSAAAPTSIHPAALRSQGDPAAIDRILEAAGARRAAAAGRRRRRLLVRRRGGAACAGDAAAHPRLHAPRRARARVPEDDRSPCAAPGRSRSPAAPTWSSRSAFASGAASTSASRPPGTPTRPTCRSTPRRPAIGWHVPAEIAVVGDPKLVLRQLADARRASWASTAPGARTAPGSPRCAARAHGVRSGAPRPGDRGPRRAPDPPGPRRPRPGRRDGPRRHDRRRQLHALRLAIAVAGGALPGPDRRRRAARAGGPRHRHGHRRAARTTGQAGRSSSSATAASASAAWTSRRRSSTGCRSCTLLWNNSSWGPSFDQMPMLRGRVDPFDMLPDLRYDRMFEAIGCHGEHVAEPDEFRPALERALASGSASVINVLGDPRIGHPRLGGNLLGSTKV